MIQELFGQTLRLQQRCPFFDLVEGVPSEASACPAAAAQHFAPVTLHGPMNFYETPEIDAFQVSVGRDQPNAISKCGDEMVRVMLYEAAQIMLVRTAKWSWVKAWAMKIARHRGMKKAIVALARRLAVIMHRIWVDGTEFRWTREVAAA